jgi:hypothetical protein
MRPRSASRPRWWPRGDTPARRSIAYDSASVTAARASTISPVGSVSLAILTSSAMTENAKALSAMYSTPREGTTL